MEQLLFDEVADVVTSLIPAELGEVRCRAHRYGIKVWFGTATAPREHYEAQVLGAAAMDEATVLVLEIGFHAEHPDEARNQTRCWTRCSATSAAGGACSAPRPRPARSSGGATTGAGCPSCGPILT